MRVVAISNQKGGCGKTTTSINLASCLALLQKKVLIIDLDPQGHSTCGLGIDAEGLDYTLYDLLNPKRETEIPVSKALVTVNPYLYLLPCYVILSALEEELAPIADKERKLSRLIERFQHENGTFDYVLIDCPPNLGLLTFNALEAADEVIIPVEPSFFSLHGLAKMTETLAFLNERRMNAVTTHALLTNFDSRTRFAEDVYQEVREHFHEKLFKTIIHEDVMIKEAAGAGQSIVDFDRDSTGYKDYFNLAVELLERDFERRLPVRNMGWNNVLHKRFGPRHVLGGTLFQAMAEKAGQVEIAGDFNGWIPEPLLARENRLWQIVIPLTKGTYRYKFIIDGEWQLDSHHSGQRPNAYGSYDSCLEVA